MDTAAVVRRPGRPGNVKVADVVVPVDTDPVAYAATAEAAAAGELVHVLVRSVAKTGKVSDPDCMTAVAFNKLLNDWMRAEWKLHTLEFTQGNESYWNVAVVFTK